MFWIKDCNGHLVNLAAAHTIRLRPGCSDGCEVNAHFGQHANEGFDITLFRGTTTQCSAYRDTLYDAMKRQQELSGDLC